MTAAWLPPDSPEPTALVTPAAMTTSEVLYAAADEVVRRGWTKGKGWRNLSAGGPVCLEGAIGAAMGVDDAIGLRCPAYYAVCDYLRERGDTLPFIWNDNLAIIRVNAAIERGECTIDNLEEFRAEAAEWAATEVIATLRAAAVIEAAKEDGTHELAVRTVAGGTAESWSAPVTVCGVGGAVDVGA